MKRITIKAILMGLALLVTGLSVSACRSHRAPEGDYPNVPYDTPRAFVPMNYFVSPEITRLDGKVIAVVPFENMSSNPTMSLNAADDANLYFGQLGGYRMVERTRVDDLIAEQDFRPDRIDEATAVAIGRMLGAHGVVLGSVLEYDAGRVGISMRLVEVETGLQLWQARDTLDSRDPRVDDLASNRYMDRALRRDPNFLMDLLIKGLVSSLKR